MSRNLLKGGYVVVAEQKKVTIDNNERIAKRLEEIQRQQQASMEAEPTRQSFAEGFVEGLDPIQVAQLVSDDVVPLEAALGQNRESGQEELQSVDPQALQEQIKEAGEEAERILSKAKEDAVRIQADAEQEGYRAGYDKGVLAAKAEYDAKAEALQREIEMRERELEQEYREYSDALEPKMVKALTDIYEYVLGIELEDSRDAIVFLLKRALSNMDTGRSYIIHVSHEDFEMVKGNREMISKGSGIPASSMEIIEDHSLSKNGCMIESDCGIFDCGLGTQLALLKKQLRILSYERTEEE